MRNPKPLIRLTLFCWAVAVCSLAIAQPAPILTWITNSSLKLEQIIGDVDWAALAQGTNLPTTSQTVTRFHILGTDNGGSFEDNGKLIVLFGDTIADTNIWEYHAADPLSWSTNTDGDSGLLLNFYTNRPYAFLRNTAAFVQPSGIVMAGNDVPKCGIVLSNGAFIICNTGSDPNNTNNPHASDYSILVTFNESNLLTLTNTYLATNLISSTNRIISALNTNLAPTNPEQGHFIFTSLHEFGTNVVMFGTGEFRASDIYLSLTPTANFLSGQGTLYFTGLTNGQPSWSSFESNSVPVVQDNPTHGPSWPNDIPSAGDLSVVNPPGLGLWLMTFNGGRNTDHTKQTEGVYFSYAPAPWGPWTEPQLIFNPKRDAARGTTLRVLARKPAGEAQREQRRPGHARHEQPARRVKRRANSNITGGAGATMSAEPVPASSRAVTMSRLFMAGCVLLCSLLPSALGGVLDGFERLADAEAARCLARWEFPEGLQELTHNRLGGHECPALGRHPVHIQQRLGREALERILAQIDDGRHVGRHEVAVEHVPLDILEADFPVVVAQRVEVGAVIEIEEFMTRATGYFALEERLEVVAVEVDLEGLLADWQARE